VPVQVQNLGPLHKGLQKSWHWRIVRFRTKKHEKPKHAIPKPNQRRVGKQNGARNQTKKDSGPLWGVWQLATRWNTHGCCSRNRCNCANKAKVSSAGWSLTARAKPLSNKRTKTSTNDWRIVKLDQMPYSYYSVRCKAQSTPLNTQRSARLQPLGCKLHVTAAKCMSRSAQKPKCSGIRASIANLSNGPMDWIVHLCLGPIYRDSFWVFWEEFDLALVVLITLCFICRLYRDDPCDYSGRLATTTACTRLLASEFQ